MNILEFILILLGLVIFGLVILLYIIAKYNLTNILINEKDRRSKDD